MSLRIIKVQCNSGNVGHVTGFFKGLGHTVDVKDTGESSASGIGTLVHVTIRPPFEPFKPDPEGLRKGWQTLMVSVVESQAD